MLAVRLHPSFEGPEEGVKLEFWEGRALLVGEVVDDADPRAAPAPGAALRALVIRQVVREALGRDRLAREARRAAALGLGHILLERARPRRRFLFDLLQGAAAPGVETVRYHPLLIALDARVALELVLALLDDHGLLGGRLGGGGFLGGGHGCDGLR